ncbi:hypothetical protein [Kitasatospora sp. NPDC005856]|uniref:hypothetical protein n=1 Tax=Kitasatospora sp. NPDC005856 TaxID=3154566 RepID=UPI0034078E34
MTTSELPEPADAEPADAKPVDAKPAAVTDAVTITTAPTAGARRVTDRVPAPPVRTPPPRPHVRSHQKGHPVARVAARLLLVLTGLATVALGFSWFVDAYDEAFAYRGAPACISSASAPVTDCTTHETGRVTGKKRRSNDDSISYEVTISREAAPTATYIVTDGLYGSVRTGVDVDFTLWRGRVVEVSYQGHRSPIIDTPWHTHLKLALLVGAGTALVVFTLLRGHRDGWIVPATACLFLFFFTFIGGVILVTVHWSSAVTLVLAIVGWLAFTAATTAICWDH